MTFSIIKIIIGLFIWMFLPRLIYGKRKDKNNMSHFFANIARKIVGIALIIYAVINLIQTLFYFESNEGNKKTFGLKQSEFLCEHCTTNCYGGRHLNLNAPRISNSGTIYDRDTGKTRSFFALLTPQFLYLRNIKY